MTNLAKIRQKFMLIVSILAVVDLLLVIYLLLPGSSQSGRTAEEKSLQNQLQTLSREVAPLQGIGDKLAQTRVDVKDLYRQNVPTEFSQISQHLEKLVQEAGVSTQGIHYKQDDARGAEEKNNLPDVKKIDIETNVIGEYAKVARFINAMEQDKYIFIIDQISLTSQESGVISLQIKFQTFLKET
jgi:Tfp pilus assembly protein PilO